MFGDTSSGKFFFSKLFEGLARSGEFVICKFSANVTVFVLYTDFFLIGLGIRGPSESLASVLTVKS